jgi:hypothetical protein
LSQIIKHGDFPLNNLLWISIQFRDGHGKQHPLR